MARCIFASLMLSFAVFGALHARHIHERSHDVRRKEAGWQAQRNDRPIIGVLSQPGDPAPPGGSYIAASYVKWLESAGARVIPIFYDMTKEEILKRFSIINGLLFPGGGAVLSPGHKFFDTASLLFDLALDANDEGDFFPVQATCLGFETLAILVSRNYTILETFDALDAPAPLMYTSEADLSRLLTSIPKVVVKNMKDKALSMENHHYGLSMEAYQADDNLKDFFSVLSLSLDKVGKVYISTMEARKYPITATQWHPEKNAFEWTPELHIPHTPEAVVMAQEMANYFVNLARRNQHESRDQLEEDNMLIYNYAASFTGRRRYPGEEKDFEQTYIFQKGDSSPQSTEV